jgi:hypothetical protein
VKEFAPLVVLEASLTASSGLDGVLDVLEFVAAQAVRPHARIAVSPAA